MFISLNFSSGVPLYRQLLQQLRERIASGQLGSGEQLPSVRDLSAQVKINPLTVAKVYQYLEREGLVETRRGLGTFVASQTRVSSLAARREQLEPALRQLVTEAMHLRLEESDVRELLRQTFQKLSPQPDQTHE